MKFVKEPETAQAVMLGTLKPGDVFTNAPLGKSWLIDGAGIDGDRPWLIVKAPLYKVPDDCLAILGLVDSALTVQSKDTEVYHHPNASFYL